METHQPSLKGKWWALSVPHGVSALLVNHWGTLSSAHGSACELSDGRICILFIFCFQGLENVWLIGLYSSLMSDWLAAYSLWGSFRGEDGE